MELCLSLSGFRPLCQPWSCKSKRANSTEEFSSTERSSSRHNVAWENIVTMESPSQLQFLFPATFSGLTFHKPKLNMVSVSLFRWLSFYIEESSVNLYLQLCCLLHKDLNDLLSLNDLTFLPKPAEIFSHHRGLILVQFVSSPVYQPTIEGK